MGFLASLFGDTKNVGVMRLDISMDHSSMLRTGVCTVKWVPLASEDWRLRPILVALLYCRILSVQKETAQHLMDMVGKVSIQNVRTEGATGFDFPIWAPEFGLGVGTQTIWPWEITQSSCSSDAKVYRATLKSAPPRWLIHLDMAFGLERILAPASALIAIRTFATTSDQEGVYELATMLWLINEYYGTSQKVRPGRESDAVLYAMEKLRAGNVTMP